MVSPHKTLGHWKAPAGKGTKQLSVLTKKGRTLAFQLLNSPATPSQAFLFYTAIYSPAIQYVLPQSFFHPAQLHQAQSKSLPLIIAKCGFLRTTAYDIIFAPYDWCGGGFTSWETFQGKGQIMALVKH